MAVANLQPSLIEQLINTCLGFVPITPSPLFCWTPRIPPSNKRLETFTSHHHFLAMTEQQSSKPRTAVLDHAAYPHIFTAIINIAPTTALLALRTTSRTIRRRVDRVLVDNLVLVGRDGRLAVGTRRPADRHTVKLAEMAPGQPAAGATYWLSLVSTARVVDLRGDLQLASPINVNTLRLHPDARYPEAGEWTCHTLVTFVHCAAWATVPRWPALRPVRVNAKRMVLTITIKHGRGLRPHQILHQGDHVPPGVEEVVVIIKDDVTRVERHQCAVGIYKTGILLDIIRQLLYFLPGKVVFVGVDVLDPRIFGLPMGTPCPMLAGNIRRAIGDYATVVLGWSHDQVDTALAGLEMLSHHEYHARVGLQEYEMLSKP